MTVRLVPDEDVVDFADSGLYTPVQVAVARARVAAGYPGITTVQGPDMLWVAPVITESPEEDGSLDDMFIKGGIESFHIERMDTNVWWFAVYFMDGSRHTFNLHSKRRIDAEHEHEPA